MADPNPNEPAKQNEVTPAAAPEKDSLWATLGWGAFLVAVGVGLYFYFGYLEEEGGRVRMNAIVLLVYNFLGRLGVLGVFGGIGALMMIFGIKGIVQKNK
ncbi:MAG TPA: hypothetical protein PLN21_00915 [Gemmatales bacterium]|nr:hypothetical protein [Gemmatales bacterium]